MTNSVVLRNLFDEQTHATIKRFVNECAPMLSMFHDTSVFHRRSANNVPFFQVVHHQLTDLACDIFDLPLKPSYSYLSLYDDGGRCPLHLDRSQCFRTIDYLIDQQSINPWPIKIAHAMDENARNELIESGKIAIESEEDIARRIDLETWKVHHLMPNDAVCYSGTHQWHYRPDPSIGTAALVFFHFVHESFDGPLT